MRAALALAVAGLAGIGCKELPEIPTEVCGNRVVEPPEDCDGFDVDGVPCRPPGGVDGCRLDCSPDENGVAAACPSGWGCSEGTVCRPATGEFVETGAPIPGNAWSLLSGDFDGDGHGDVLSVERPLSQGITKARIQFFGDRGEPVANIASEKLMASPTVSQITPDERSDIAYSFGTFFVLSGERDRSLLSQTYPSYFVGDSPSRSLFIADRSISDRTPIAVFGRLDETDGIFVFDHESPFLRLMAELDGGVEDFAADPVVGEFLDDFSGFPCNEIVVAIRGATEFSIYSLCESSATDALQWRDEPYVQVVPLDPPARIEQGIVTTDLDGDGRLDILVGTEDGPYAAFGDGIEFGPARRQVFPVDAFIPADAMPLAGSDITGDGVVDLVFPEGIAFSEPDPSTGELRYVTVRARFGEAWSEARFADLNADGLLDLACGSDSALDIDFFLGTGSFAINTFIVSTERPTENFIVADLDGDLVSDLAFTELRRAQGEPEQIAVAFGRRSGGPESPVPVAELEDVDQMVAFAGDPTSTVANVIISFSQTRDDDRENAIGFIIGSSDRRPVSPIELTTFSADGSVLTSTSVMVTVGSFRRAGQTDALPYAVERAFRIEDAKPQMWLIQDITHKSQGPESIGWPFDPRTKPVGGPSGTDEVSARLAAGDFDGDGVDEVVFVAPGDDQTCIVNVAGVVEDPPVLELRDVVELDAPCYESALAIVDFDTDGARDIILLAGKQEETRSPVVLWNDGDGDFDAARALSIAREGESVAAFTTFRGLDGSLSLAYVTASSLRWVKPLARARSFGNEQIPLAPELEQATGIVATDVDGDGIVDLAVADSGNIRILRAGLAP